MLKDLYNIITPDYAVNWRTIGENLGIRNGILDAIGHDNHHKAEDCCNAMWEEWLNIDTSASWSKLIQIIDSPKIVSSITNKKDGMDAATQSAVQNASDQMRQFYINERYKSTEDDWPLYQPNHFTSVALIHHKEKYMTNREVFAVASRTFKGNVKVDINNDRDEYFMKCQSTKDITEIFKFNSPQKLTASSSCSMTPNIILIEGAPGIGKTILSREISFQWANKKLLANKVLLFLIYLRDPFIKQITCLQQFVSYAICSSEQNKTVELITEYLENTSGLNATFVFDGYDEISVEIRQKSFIAKIINKQCLKLCGLVITSRPAASAVLHAICDCRVEILGFTKEDRMEYIKQSLQGNLYEIAQLTAYLEKNPFINSLCYIPLNMTILICLYKEFSENVIKESSGNRSKEFLEDKNVMLPKNQTEMNEQFIWITISRFLRKQNNALTVRSLRDLPKPYKQQFKILCKLAFRLLGEDHIVFSDDDIKHYVDWSDLGLLKTVKYSSYLKPTPVVSYNFLHFSLQEYLAAFYVTSLSRVKQISILNDNLWNSRYINSWIMYAGLTKGASFALSHVLTGRMFIFHSLIIKPKGIAYETVSDKIKCLHLFQCFLEAGDDKMCQQVGNSLLDKDIDLSNTTLLPKDMHTLCFFLIRSTNKQWKKLDLSNCYIGDDGCNTLTNLLLGNDNTNMHIKILSLSNNHLTSRSIPAIFKLVQKFSIEELTVTNNSFDNSALLGVIFRLIIQHDFVQEMLLSIRANKNSLSVLTINCINLLTPQLKSLQNTNNICSLYLWNTNVMFNDLLMLLQGNTVPSKQLNVFKEDLDDQLISTYLFELQKIIKNITEGNNSLQDPVLHLKKVSYVLVSKTKMYAHNANHDQIVQALLSTKYKSSIKLLSITTCVLYSKSLYTIGNVLSINFKEVKSIDLSDCNIEDQSCDCFCETLFSCTSVVKNLKEFNLSHNKLTSACLFAIIKSLRHCVVEKLDISYNEIQENEFSLIFKLLYEQCTLLDSTLTISLFVTNVSCLQSKFTQSVNRYAEAYFMKDISVDISDSLVTSVNNKFLHHVLFFDCNSLIKIFDMIALLLKEQIKIEIQERNTSDLVATKLIARFNEVSYHYKNFQCILISETNLYVCNHEYEEIKALLPCDSSKALFQFKNCNIADVVAIPQILTNVNFAKRVQIVDLSGCKIGDSGCETFCNNFKCCRSEGGTDLKAYLHELNLSNNCLTSISTIYITKLLQLFTLNKLVLSHNNIDTDNFNVEYFKNRYDAYSNFGSRVPLIVVNNGINNEATEKDQQSLEHLHFTTYLLFTPHIEDLTNILSMTAHDECHGWIFLINTNIPMDWFNKIMKLLLANNMMKITIIEEYLHDNVADNMMIQLKKLQASRYNENGDCKSIHYLLLSKNNYFANNTNQILFRKMVNYSELQDFFFDYLLFSPSFPFNICSSKHWELIDLSNCNIGDNGCTILLDYFTHPQYANTVNFLNLSNNELSSHSIDNLAKLIVYSKLQILFVSHNKVKENAIADAVCKLEPESSRPNIPLIQIFHNHCVALIICNLIISSVDKLLDLKLCNVTYLLLMNCYLHYEEHTYDYLNELNLSQRMLQELQIEYNVDASEENKMTHFIIKNSSITHKATMPLACKLLKDSLLTHLEISQCKLQEIGLFDFLSAVEEISSLQSINLKSNFITEAIAGKIANIISKNSQLNALDLSECYMQKAGVTYILNVLSKLSSLEIINLSCMQYQYFVNHHNNHQQCLDPQSLAYSFMLLPSIISKNQSLKYINISNCKVAEDDFANIMKNLALLKSIKHLDISGNIVTDIVADYVANAIRNNRDLEYLNVSNCHISEHGLFVIFNALSDLSSLLHLDVSLNGICSTAAEEIINVFSLNRKLAHLSLHQCNLNGGDFLQVMSSVRKNGFITHLDVSHNQMYQNTPVIISNIILNNPLLKYLDISFSKLTDEGIKIFADCLTKLPNIKHFVLCRNDLSHSSAKNIALAIASNESLEYLDLSECCFVDYRVIYKSLQKGCKLKSLILRSSVIFPNRSFVQATDSAEGNSSYLEHLDLSNCQLSELQVNHVFRQLLQMSTLRSINFSYNTLSNDATADIGSVISCNILLEKLSLSGCELSESQITNILKALSNLSRLKHLDISHNKVADNAASELASALAANPLLEHLNLSNCELSELHIAGIVRAFSEKESFLNFLDISSSKVTENSLCEIAAVITFNPLLEHLNVANCELSEIQIINMFKALRKTLLLKFLDISHNEVTNEAANEITSVIMNNKSLQYINLNSCNLFEDSLMLIAESLTHLSFLISIDVSYNCITEKAAQNMAVAIAKNKVLEQLHFCCCFTDNTALTVFNAIKQLRSLTHLNVRWITVTNELANMVEGVLKFNTNIIHLDLGYCNLQKLGFCSILRALRNATLLQYLNLESNCISENLALNIASVIRKNLLLKHINLCNCSLSNEGIKGISYAISKLKSIECLNIRNNKICKSACSFLRAALSNNKKIKYLDVSGCITYGNIAYSLMRLNTTYLNSLNFQSCCFKDESVSEWLPNIIIQNKSLQLLNLAYCHLKENGLVAITRALQMITSLKHLYLGSNCITNAASLEIALVVSTNCKLQSLSLCNCGLQETELMVIAQALHDISSIKHLDLSHNNITDRAATVIASAIANNAAMKYLDFSFCTWQKTGITVIYQVINKLSMIKEVDFRLHTSEHLCT